MPAVSRASNEQGFKQRNNSCHLDVVLELLFHELAEFVPELFASPAVASAGFRGGHCLVDLLLALRHHDDDNASVLKENFWRECHRTQPDDAAIQPVGAFSNPERWFNLLSSLAMQASDGIWLPVWQLQMLSLDPLVPCEHGKSLLSISFSAWAQPNPFEETLSTELHDATGIRLHCKQPLNGHSIIWPLLLVFDAPCIVHMYDNPMPHNFNDRLLQSLLVLGALYDLAGVIVHVGNHFVLWLFSNGRWRLHDGMRKGGALQNKRFFKLDHKKGHQVSYVIFRRH